ncbi:MAG: putative baseplate assembly protein [Heteroscytonema crispum UTEX LB 1556]
MATQYRNITSQPGSEQRREKVRNTKGADGKPIVNGIDFLEVSKDQRTLSVHFIHNLPGEDDAVPPQPKNYLSKENVVIQGGALLQSLSVESVTSFGNILTLKVSDPGDIIRAGISGASNYILRLVNLEVRSQPPDGFDPQLSQVEFSFQVDEGSEFDCKSDCQTPQEKPTTPPVIDYLAKDYASFRQLMLDRLTITMPDWRERNPSDLGVMLVELLAYAGDRLSYYQDAVATEAYLSTARQRVSIRRHARLLDYPMHDGCNARTWITLEVNNTKSDKKMLSGASENRPGTRFFTKADGLRLEDWETLLQRGVQVFETMHDITLYKAHNEIHFYTWGNDEDFLAYCLSKGVTKATLVDSDGTLRDSLKVGDVLIFEEVKGPDTGNRYDADPGHRHAVRLTEVRGAKDPLLNRDMVEIQWAQEDALPFTLWICTIVDDELKANVSVARGNVVLVDCGCTVEEILSEVQEGDRYRPRLQQGPLTQQGYVRLNVRELYAKGLASGLQGRQYTFDPTAPASQALSWDIRDVQPQIWLQQQDDSGAYWRPQLDLLNSDSFAREFVVETQDDGRAYLRFGDSVLGKRPEAGIQFKATYRIGNGSLGNVGAEAIAHIQPDLQDLIVKVRNPLPAKGGVDPEPIEQVRLYAPQAFRTQKRAVTEGDYAAIAQQFSGVRKAVATRRWTGSWYTIFITVDREGGLAVDDEFKEKLSTFLERFRLAGVDIKIEAPIFIPLDIALTVNVAVDYFRSDVKKELLAIFSNSVLIDGKLGFFHPDNFTFGQPVYLSQIIATAMQVAGVVAVEAKRFQRLGQPQGDELQTGQISFERLEIAVLDNDPNAPRNGKISFEMKEGL